MKIQTPKGPQSPEAHPRGKGFCRETWALMSSPQDWECLTDRGMACPLAPRAGNLGDSLEVA